MKTAIYVRSALRDDANIEKQITECKRRLNGEEFVIFCDNGYSAHDDNRPAFNEMVNAIKNGEVQKVVVHSLDCVCRNFNKCQEFFQLLKKHHVPLECDVDIFEEKGTYYINMLSVFEATKSKEGV